MRQRIIRAALALTLLAAVAGFAITEAPPASAHEILPQNVWLAWGPTNPGGNAGGCVGGMRFGTFAGTAYGDGQMGASPACDTSWPENVGPTTTRILVTIYYQTSTTVTSSTCYVDRRTNTVGTYYARDPASRCVDMGSIGGQEVVQVQARGYIVGMQLLVYPWWDCQCPYAYQYETTYNFWAI